MMKNYTVTQAGQGLLYVYLDGKKTNWVIKNINGKWELWTASGSIVSDLARLIHDPIKLGKKIGELIEGYERVAM